jgi:hypothetical protein
LRKKFQKIQKKFKKKLFFSFKIHSKTCKSGGTVKNTVPALLAAKPLSSGHLTEHSHHCIAPTNGRNQNPLADVGYWLLYVLSLHPQPKS